MAVLPLSHAVRRCNVSASPKRTRCRGSAYPLQDLLVFLSQWDSVPGFIGFGTAYFIHLVSLLQCDLGVAGAIGEIGVAGGKSFAVLAFTRQRGEVLRRTTCQMPTCRCFWIS